MIAPLSSGPAQALLVGVDIGGTTCQVGAVDTGGRLLDKGSFSVRREQDPADFLNELNTTINNVVRGRPISGIGVLLPGYMDSSGVEVYKTVNIPWLEGVALPGILQDRFQVPVTVEIDRNAPALAEHRLHHPHSERMLYLCIGTGVGAALVVDGSLSRFCNDSIGELGHVTLVPHGEPCACGNRGCVEQYVSKRGVALIAKQLDLWSGAYERRAARDCLPEILYEDAGRGDQRAVRIFEEFGRYLGVALVSFANAISPDTIVVGGGLAEASALFLPVAARHLNGHWFERTHKPIAVHKSGLGLDAGIVGATTVARSS